MAVCLLFSFFCFVYSKRMILLAILICLLSSAILIIRARDTSEHYYALPYTSLRAMRNARMARDVRCTDGCIVRLRDRDVIDGQCKHMCVDYYPQSYQENADCGWGWGGYHTTSNCTMENLPSYAESLQDSLLDENVGQYKYSFIE